MAPTRLKILDWLCLVFVLVNVLFVFGPVGRSDFLQWDDYKTIASNPDLNPPSVSGVLRYWDPRHPYMDLYVPVAYTAWAGVASIAATTPSPGGRPRLDPTAFHVASLVVHAVATLFAFLILLHVLKVSRSAPVQGSDRPVASAGRRRKLDPIPWAAGIGAGLFALHPLQVETVAWASGLKDLLGGAFTLAALWLYLLFAGELRRPREEARTRQDGRASPHARARAAIVFTFATVAFVLAMLSKPSAVVTPLLAACLVLMISWRPQRDTSNLMVTAGTKRALAPLGLWLLLALPVVLVARHAQPAATGFASPLWARPLVALDALAFYAYKLVVPVRLAMDYGRSPDWLITTPFLWWTWTIPVAIGAAVAVLARRRAPWLVGAALFPVAALLPVLGLVRFDFQSHSTVADHYVYVALLGPALVLALVLSRRPAFAVGLVAGLVLSGLSALSRLQVPVWHDSTSLFTHTLDVNPRSLAGHINLGHILFVQGRTEEALRHDEAALATRPDEPEAHNNLGNALLRLKRPKEAAEHYRAALLASPDSVSSHFNLGLALFHTGDPAGAAREYEEALRLEPRYAPALANRAELYLNAGDYDKAADLYRRALEANPALAPARRGLANAMRGQAGETAPR